MNANKKIACNDTETMQVGPFKSQRRESSAHGASFSFVSFLFSFLLSLISLVLWQ